MTQETRVYQTSARILEALQRELTKSLPPGAEWRSTPYAVFAVKSDGVVFTGYRSGKAVLQGKELDAFEARHLAALAGSGTSSAGGASGASSKLEAIAVPTLGSDESGKGDYFGPLVVAAVFATPADAGFLREVGAIDSKLLADAKMRTQAGRIEERLDHAIALLMPPDYNAEIERTGNANHVLAALHARALAEVARRNPSAARTVVDRFSSGPVLENAFATAGFVPPALDLRPGAESHPAVAAASILARVHFLEGLARCTEECATDLPKGAGTPVDEAAKRVVAIGGSALLAKVAKIHFKNTMKIRRHDP